MDQQTSRGVYRRKDSNFWWIDTTLPNGKRIRQSTGTEDKFEAEALLAKIKLESYREHHFGIKPQRSWQEAVVRFLAVKGTLRDIKGYQGICRRLDEYLGQLALNQINGDVIWGIVQGELKRGNKIATLNRHLAVTRAILRMARDEWQWIDSMPKIRLLSGEVERDRWLTRAEAEALIEASAPHLAAMIRFALATGCRAREITGLEWKRVDLKRGTAWLDKTKNGTPRGVPLNADAIEVLEELIGEHQQYVFTYQGQPIKRAITNHAWYSAVKKAGLFDLRFHDLRHTWASWHRQAGTTCDELKDLGGWKSRTMVDRYAKFATEQLTIAASRIATKTNPNVVDITSRLRHATK